MLLLLKQPDSSLYNQILDSPYHFQVVTLVVTEFQEPKVIVVQLFHFTHSLKELLELVELDFNVLGSHLSFEIKIAFKHCYLQVYFGHFVFVKTIHKASNFFNRQDSFATFPSCYFTFVVNTRLLAPLNKLEVT